MTKETKSDVWLELFPEQNVTRYSKLPNGIVLVAVVMTINGIELIPTSYQNFGYVIDKCMTNECATVVNLERESRVDAINKIIKAADKLKADYYKAKGKDNYNLDDETYCDVCDLEEFRMSNDSPLELVVAEKPAKLYLKAMDMGDNASFDS